MELWRDANGRHWIGGIENSEYDQSTQVRTWRMPSAVQDPHTGRWTPADGETIDVAGHPSLAGYTEVSADPLADPRIARLHHLITELLADIEQLTGHPAITHEQTILALEDVAFIPEEGRRRARGRARNAARAAHH
uniref:hypothetical protein n=2 Tax=Bacillati TaxID=1783272 RepID=UPI00366E08F8